MSANLMSLARSGGKFLKLFGDRKMMKQLPYDAEIEYLESTGTQWIHIPYNKSPHIDVTVKCQLLQSRDFTYCFAIIDGSQNYPYGVRWNKDYCYVITPLGSVTLSDSSQSDGVVTIRMYNNNTGESWPKLYGIYNGANKGSQYNSKSYSESGTNLFNYGSYYSMCRIFGFTATSEATGQHFDILPVRVGTVGYMYDRVSGELFGNSGTGDFVVGPDKTT